MKIGAAGALRRPRIGVRRELRRFGYGAAAPYMSSRVTPPRAARNRKCPGRSSDGDRRARCRSPDRSPPHPGERRARHVGAGDRLVAEVAARGARRPRAAPAPGSPSICSPIRAGSSRPCRSASRWSASSPAPMAARRWPTSSAPGSIASPVIAPNGDAEAFGFVVVVITYLSLIVGELVPKRIAMTNPERIAALVARPMRILSRVAAPAVWLLRHSTDAVLRLLRLGGAPRLDDHRGGGQGADRRRGRRPASSRPRSAR